MAFLLWDLDWLKPIVERQASLALGRPVTLAHIRSHWSPHPTVVFADIRIDNPDGFAQSDPFGTIDRLAVTINPWPLLHKAIVLQAIEIGRVNANLTALASGQNNWTFPRKSSSTPDNASSDVRIGRIDIKHGHLHLLDPRLKSDFQVDIATPGNEPAESALQIDAIGSYAGQPIVAHFRGGTVLNLRDTQQPYPVALDVANGPTILSLHGTVLDPLKFAGANLALTLRGDDMEALYQLTSVPFPHTPPFDLKGQLDYANGAFRFKDFSGRVGDSDLSGTIAVSPFESRRKITADLNSKKVVLADLAGFLGSTPGKADSRTQGSEQKAERAQQSKSPNLLPDKPINLPRILSADFDVHYAAERIESEHMPLDNLKAHLLIEDGRLSLQPLDFAVGPGHIVSHLVLDGTQSPATIKADVDFRQIDLKRIVSKASGFKGDGTIGGAAALDSHGNSVAQWLGNGDGRLTLFLSGGNLSALLIDLAGFDFGNSFLATIGVPSRANLRCMVGDFGLSKGNVDTKIFLIDTDTANIIGGGKLNLADETVDYTIHTEPKRPSVGSIPAPIDIKGPLKSPSIAPQPGPLAARAATAAALGALATPLAALIPTIQLGLGKDNSCQDLVDTARRDAQSTQAEAKKAVAAEGRDRHPRQLDSRPTSSAQPVR